MASTTGQRWLDTQEVAPMFIRGSRLKVPVDRVQDVIAHFKDRTAPEAKEVAGNQGAVLLVDRGTGACWGLTYWENEAALRASEEAGTRLREQVAGQFDGTIEDVDRLEQVIQERVGPPRAGTFVRVNDIQGDPGRVEDAIRFTRDKVVPAMRGQQGFVALLTGVDRQTGRGITSTVWETLDELKASEAAAAPLREEALETSGAKSVKVEVFESVFAEIFQPVTHA